LSKNVAVFVDVANLYYSARGQDVDVDYVALLKAATKGRDLVRAYAYSGLDPENENQRKFIDFLGKNGYKVVHKDIRKFGDGRVKANLDIELVVDLFRVKDRMDIAVIVSGDGDFAPAIRALQDVGVRCEVISFRPNTSSDLIAVADEFTDIMKIASIGREKTAKGMSAPPMPAKEVEPDFAFREASPSVAAAALAAIKGGASTRGGRGRSTHAGGNGRRRQAAAEPEAEEPAEGAATEPVASGEAEHNGEHHLENGNGDGRRRRRRRGGRGRGRRGHGEAHETEEAGAGHDLEEIGWQELEDLSELGDLDEDREYEFAEADAETLAELGLPPAAAAAEPEQPDQAEETPAAKPRARRGRTAKAQEEQPVDAQQAEAGQAETKPEPKTRRRRSKPAEETQPTAAAAEGQDVATADAAAAPKKRATRGRPRKTAQTAESGSDDGQQSEEAPAKRNRSRARKTEPAGEQTSNAGTASNAGASGSAASDGGEEPQGIWQRFRSARTTRS
jgi:uncharacterized LabA/DUF88 family protein